MAASRTCHRSTMLKRPCIRRPWSDLPDEILECVLHHVGSIRDRMRFRAVCKSWRSVEPFKFPWLIFSPFFQNPRAWSLFSLAEGRTFPRELPIEMTARCLGSSKGWLIIVSGVMDYYLLNPMTRDRVHLPSPSSRSPYYFDKAALSSSSTPENLAARDCVVAAILHRGRSLVFCRPGQKTWTKLQGTGPYSDIMFHDGLLYATNGTAVAAFHLPHPTARLLPELQAQVGWRGVSTYLVESGGDLLMVRKGYDIQGERVDIKIYKLDPDAKQWEPVESLGDRMLFLDNYNSKSAMAPLHSSLERGCIYFTHVFRDGDSHCDLDRYCLKDGSIEESFHTILRISDIIRPVWFMPD